MNYPQLERAIEIVAKLRDPQEGCPWDLKQTHQSLLRYLLEEAYEYIEATESGDLQKMESELGDILLQVLLHSRIAEQEKTFSLESVAQKLADKLIYRHPHVFDPEHRKLTEDEVLHNWEVLKKQEKQEKQNNQDEQESLTFGTDLLRLPSLLGAFKIGQKTHRIKFDWDNYSQVIYKVEEEWQELKEELAPGVQIHQDRVEEELGDLLFSVAQLARHLGVEPEEALRKANKKFIERFNTMEELAELNEKKSFSTLSPETKERYWDKAKAILKKNRDKK